MLISPWHRLTPAGAGMVRLDRVCVCRMTSSQICMCSKQMKTMMTHDPCSSWHGINSLGMMTGAVMIAVMTGAGTTAGTTGGMTGGTTGGRMIGWPWHGWMVAFVVSKRPRTIHFTIFPPESSFDDLHTFLGILNTFMELVQRQRHSEVLLLDPLNTWRVGPARGDIPSQLPGTAAGQIWVWNPVFASSLCSIIQSTLVVV